MTAHDSHPPEGRRARKRRETDHAIALAGVELALEHGYANVTVESICDRADVSRSTFFNYYPSRDAAIVGRSLPTYTPGDVEAAFTAHPGNLVRGVIALTGPSLQPTDEATSYPLLRARLVAEQPEALRQYSNALLGSQDSLTAGTLAWLREHPETGCLPDRPEIEAILTVTAAYAIMYAVTDGWSTSLLHIRDIDEKLVRAETGLRAVLGVAA